jgi:polysaccharide export outer membrane protein
MVGSKTFWVWFGVILLTCFVSGEVVSAQEEHPSIALADYRICAGDVLQIDVWNQPEITRTIPVRPDGSISLPVINEVKASGLSAMELAGLLRDKLKDIIHNPQVTITVAAHGTKHLAAPPLPLLPGKFPPPPISPDLKHKCCIA